MKIVIEFEYEIGDEVYHKTPDSPRGIIIAWRYHSGNKEPDYEVAFGYLSGDTVWCTVIELSNTKTF
jgi:hypothetical protein